MEIGRIITLSNGKRAKIIEEVLFTSDGVHYLVEIDNEQYILKWYDGKYRQDHSKYIQRKIDNPINPKSFIWPLVLTEVEEDGYGYITNKFPEGYFYIGALRLAKVIFSGVDAMLNATIKLCLAFRDMHIAGYNFYNVDDINFIINPEVGDVMIVDRYNNISFPQSYIQTYPKLRYIAPEVVDGNITDESDNFSLAIMLFILLYNNHPFEGKKSLYYPDLTYNVEKQIYGRDGVFIMDPADDSNRPVNGIHINVIRRWNLFPAILGKAFQAAFRREAILEPQKRTTTDEWIKILSQVKNSLVDCPNCNKRTFINTNISQSRCVECDQDFTIPALLIINKFATPLLPNRKIFLDITDDDSVIGYVVKHRTKENIYGLRNTSDYVWSVETPIGTKTVNKGEVMPIRKGYKIGFTADITGAIQ